MTFRSLHSRGFTLIELMVSMAVGSIILLTAAALLGTSGDGYERIGGNVAVEREARALLTQLGSDLATARYHKNSVIEKSTTSWPVDRLGFLSLQPAVAQTEKGRIGDLCAVNYYIKDLTVDGRTIRCLMRGFRESVDTFEALGKNDIPSLFVERENIDEPVAFGVVSFEARPISRDTSGAWTDWVKKDGTGPEAIEVSLIIARRNLAGKLKKPGDWDGEGAAGRLLGKASEVDRNGDLEKYVTIIRFGNHDNS